MRFGKYLRFLFMVLAIAVPLQAVETTFWQVGSFDEFLQGTLTGLSLSKEGELTLAPASNVVFSPEEALAISLARDRNGNIYIGTGHQGKVFKVGSDQKATLFFTAQEPDIFAMAVGPDGALYVGSSPSGKIYKITGDGKSSVFYAPKTKYIWALLFDAQGRLYAGTGDKGDILRIDPSGKDEVFFESKQTHIMCLNLDPQGNILAGSVPNGLIYRITPQGHAFVVYQSALPEIHDLAVDSHGNIYAATLGGIGGKGTPELLLPAPGGVPGGAIATITVTASTKPDQEAAKGQTPPNDAALPSFNRASPQPIVAAPPINFSLGHGAIIKISPDSNVETVWSSNTESAFGIAVRDNHLLFSTDSNGRIFDLEPSRDGEKLTLLDETHETLATRLLQGGTDLYVTTSNVAKVLRIQGSPSKEGTFEAPVKDTKFVSRWGVLAWRGEVPAGTAMKFFTRSGNSDRPDNTWSDWAGPYSNPHGDAVASPPARFIQWKAVLQTSGSTVPTLNEVTVAYLNQNLPPQIRSLTVSTSGERTGVAGTNQPIGGITISTSPSVTYGPPGGSNPPVKLPVTLTWQADDPNNDQLVYSLYIRGADETEWHLLKDKLHQATYTIDPTALADGKYVARLVASDEDSNPPNLARKSELQSAPFWVDNTPPEVEAGKQTVTGSAAEVQFVVEDGTSPLRIAEASLDGHDWYNVLSDDGVVDSRKETFTVKLPGLAEGEHILLLRAYDTSGNAGVGKAVIRVARGGARAR